MNPDLTLLQPYPFEKLAALRAGITPPADRSPIALSIGEPQHAPPAIVVEALMAALDGLARYPLTKGEAALRRAIAGWLTRRFALGDGAIDSERQVLPVAGTREALFAFAQAQIARHHAARVVMPNPFYQIYEGAALLAGAQPYFMACDAAHDFLPDPDSVPAAVWEQTQLLYLCTPGNPSGAVMPLPLLQRFIALADQYDFIIASDECYSEIYHDEANPPPGLLQAAAAMGRYDWQRCVVFHSLSKRSNLPGLRSGFVAGDADLLHHFLRYRTYHGCALPPPTQAASIAAWQDEDHVRENRACYREKFAAVVPILQSVLPVTRPAASFYLWSATPTDDATFARDLYAAEHLTVLPGSYLSRLGTDGRNPGAGRVRMALVASLEECVEAAQRIERFLTRG